MATITTTTNANPLRYPMTTSIDRNPMNGYLYAMVKATGGEFEIWASVNLGASWFQVGTDLVRANVVEWSSIRIDNSGYLNWAYRTNESSEDRLYFRRFWLDYNTWGPELLLTAVANGGVGGALLNGLDVSAIYMYGIDVYCGAVAAGTTLGGQTGVTLYGWYAASDGVEIANPNMFGSVRQWLTPGAGRTTPSVELEHIGDDKHTDNPNLWVTWGRTTVNLVKCAWNGAGWQAPTLPTFIGTNVTAQDGITGRWDGSRFLVVVPNPAANTTVAVWERNQANSSTTTRTTPVHPTGVVRNCTAAYNGTNKDIRVFAVGTTNATMYYVDYARALGTWSAWTQYSATAILGTNGENYCARRTSFGGSKYDVYVAQSSGPSNLIHTAQSVSYVPLAPLWDYTGFAYRSGDAWPSANSLGIQWIFQDPDPADTMGSWAIRRQIGAGAFAYLRNSDNTWQVTEQQNTGTSPLKVITAGTWASGPTEATHQYWVKTWDASGNAGPYSATSFAVVPSAYVNPTIVTPAAAAVISTSLVTMTWTVSEQTEFIVTLATNPGGVSVYSSGWVVDAAARSFTIPYSLGDGTGWTITFWTKNNEGLISGPGGTTRSFTVQYVDPAAPIPSYTLLPALGVVRVAIANPTPSGTQPAVASNELWRRRSTSDMATLNVNPDFEVNILQWTAVGSATITRSTVQAKLGVGSARVVPNGVASAGGLVSTAGFPTAGGGQFFCEAWIRADTVNKPVSIRVDWYSDPGGTVFISSSTLQRQPVAGVWIYLSQIFTAPPTAQTATMSVRVNNTPAAGDAFYADEIRVRAYNGDDGVRIATGLVNNGSYDDFQAASATPYTYRVHTLGVDGTDTYGPWTP